MNITTVVLSCEILYDVYISIKRKTHTHIVHSFHTPIKLLAQCICIISFSKNQYDDSDKRSSFHAVVAIKKTLNGNNQKSYRISIKSAMNCNNRKNYFKEKFRILFSV